MPDTTVVVDAGDEEPASTDATAFAAGAAAAISAQASQDAAEATEEAEHAVDTANAAAGAAADAQETAYTTRVELDALRTELLGAVDALGDKLTQPPAAESVAPQPVEEAPSVEPEPETDDTDDDSSRDEKPAEPRYGAGRWFGS